MMHQAQCFFYAGIGCLILGILILIVFAIHEKLADRDAKRWRKHFN